MTRVIASYCAHAAQAVMPESFQYTQLHHPQEYIAFVA